MDKEIRRLLKLSRIPGFRLTEQEQATLEGWKNMQEAVIIKPAKKTRSKASKTRSKTPLESETVVDASAVEKVQNIITNEEKTLNQES